MPVKLPMSNRQHQFEALVRAYSTDLYRYAYWLCGQDALAQDLVQDTFLRAWRGLDKLREVAAVKAWLITILRREHARLFERKAMPSDDIDDFDLPDPQATPAQRDGAPGTEVPRAAGAAGDWRIFLCRDRRAAWAR